MQGNYNNDNHNVIKIDIIYYNTLGCLITISIRSLGLDSVQEGENVNIWFLSLGPVSQRHGRTAILRPSYDATFIFSPWSYDCFTKLVIKGSQIYDLS